jgi:hypothetical protein
METINTAIELLENLTGLKVRFTEKCREAKNFEGCVDIFVGNHTYRWYVILKNELTANYLLRIKDTAALLNAAHHLLIITAYINPNVREQAQKLELNYLDVAGNTFLKQEALFIKIDGNQRQIDTQKLKNRAFTNAGLKVLFYFLLDPANVNKTIREIAADTDTALDTVHKTINALIQMKYILKVNENEYRLIHANELLDRWIQDFDLKLKNKLFMGVFRFARKEDELKWKTLEFKNSEAYWGGEAAGAILTKYLHPGILTLYTTCNRAELAKNYKLLPDTKGNIRVYTKFWKFNHTQKNTVPALLAYTDLIATGDDRCIETAKMIYNEFLADRYK